MKILEENVPFSASKLWQFQRDYFDRKGVDAWAGQVPFYITSNPVIAHTYAQVMLHFMRDLVAQKRYDASQPIYIIELGTGSGRFSFYCLQELQRLQKILHLEDIRFCYVMTDFTESNVRFWQQHHLLQPFVAAQQLDFALFDMEQSTEITLQHAKVQLTEGSIKNPLIVLGNYIFDTVSNDVFRVQDKKIKEAVVTLKTDENNLDAEGNVKLLEHIEARFSYRDMSNHYYHDAVLSSVVNNYADTLRTASVLIPIGGLYAVQRLMALANGRLLLLSTDKGYTHLSELEDRPDPTVIFHGSFSMSVNFHAIGEFFKGLKGDVYFQTIRKSIKTVAFIVGDSFANLPATLEALQTYVEDFGPGDFFNFHEHLKKTKAECELKTILSHLYFCRFDPHVFRFFVECLVKDAGKVDAMTIENLLSSVRKIADHVYPMPGAHDTYFDIAILMHAIERYPEALHYYQLSYEHFTRHHTLLFNMGLCHYFLLNKHMALSCFKEALTYSHTSKKEAEQWITRINVELSGGGSPDLLRQR